MFSGIEKDYNSMELSIITINYNNLEGLQKTINSVVSQTWRNFEWIVIDGGSTDGSKELIEKYQDHFTYWCSEPDKGVYNAMNKGIAKAGGEFLLFMNSGDMFVDERVIDEFISAGWSEDYITGDVILDGDVTRIMTYPDEKDMDLDYMRHGVLCHQSSFIHRSLFTRYGVYDETMHIAADWKFALEVIIIHGCDYRHWNRIVADYATDGISGIVENQCLHWQERAKVLSQYSRIIRSINKRDKRIQELDLPIMVILRRKALAKLKKWMGVARMFSVQSD